MRDPVNRALIIALILLLPAGALAQESRIEPLTQAARANPRDYDAQVALGHALIEAGHFRRAQQTLQRASRLRRDDPAAQYEPIRVLFAQSEHRRARAACRRLARAHRDSAWAHLCTARAFLAWNRAGRAFEELEAALGAEANHYESLVALGDAHRLRSAVAEAESAYRRAIAANGQASEPHFGLGQLYAQARRHDDALAALRRAHELSPDDPDVDLWLGRELSGAEAVTHLRDAVANRPGWAIARAELGDALLATGDHDAAIAAFRQAIREDDNLAHARAGLGRALMAAGQLQEAEAALDEAIEQVPNDADSAAALAAVYAQTDRVEEAYVQYRRAADLDPRNPGPLTDAARLALQQQRPVLATAFLVRVTRVHRDYAPALAMLGDIMRSRNQNDEARDYYQRALSGTGEIDRAAVQASLRAVGGG